MRHKNSQIAVVGFTLVEVMIAITIIAVLAALVISNLMKSQKRGYDAQRQGDMRTIQNAFEQYYAVNERYPLDETEASSEFPGNRLPADPRDYDVYQYSVSYDAGGNSYCVCAQLEVASGNDSDGDCTYDISDPVYFCVSNLQ